MYKELIRYALPLSFVGLAIPLYQLIDMFTYSSALETYGFTGQEAESAFGIFARTSHSVILIPVAVATAMSVNIIPAITRSNTNGDRDEMNAYMTKCFYIILFFTVPAMAGLMILSTPAFATLFGMDDYILGGQILQMYAPAAVLFSLFAVTAAMLQGMNKQKQAIMGLVIGLVIKLSLTYVLTVLFGVGGAIVATLLGYSTAIVYNVVSIRKATNYEVNQLKRPALKVALITVVMVVAVAIVQAGGQHVFDASTQLGMVSILAFGVVTGGLLYFVLAVRTGLAADVLGDRFTLLRK